MLGEQFNRTYWEEGDRLVTQNIDPTSHVIKGKVDLDDAPGDRQGMFFSPESGTRTGSDPWEDQEARRQTIRDKLDLTDPGGERYEQRVGRVIGRNRLRQVNVPGKKTRIRQAEEAVESLAKSDMPTHVIEQMRQVPVTVVDKSIGRSTGGQYDYTRDEISIRETSKARNVRTTQEVAVAGGEIIKNPRGGPDPDKWTIPGVQANGFLQPHPSDPDYVPVEERQKARHRQYAKYYEEALERHGGDVNKLPPYIKPPPDDPADIDLDRYDEGDRRIEDPSILWSGPPKSSDKYFAEIARFPDNDSDSMDPLAGRSIRGWSRSRIQDRDQHFHVRRKPTAFEEQTVWKRETVHSVSPWSTAHELGHANDRDRIRYDHTVRGDNRKADPIEEGIADGYADRYVNPQISDHYSTENRASVVRLGGYGTSHSGWENQDERSAYAAARQFIATGGEASEVPMRRDLHFRAYWNPSTSPEQSGDLPTARLVAGALEERSPAVRELLSGRQSEHLPDVRSNREWANRRLTHPPQEERLF